MTFGNLSLARFNLTSIPEKSFQHVRAKALDLNGNQFSKVGLIADGAFSGISSSLHVLSLADCELQRVPPALSHLRHFFLNRNQLKKIDNSSFDSVSHLDELKLSENQLQSIQPHLFSKLSKFMNLDLSQNFIYMLHPGNLRRTSKIVLARHPVQPAARGQSADVHGTSISGKFEVGGEPVAGHRCRNILGHETAAVSVDRVLGQHDDQQRHLPRDVETADAQFW